MFSAVAELDSSRGLGHEKSEASDDTASGDGAIEQLTRLAQAANDNDRRS